MFAVSCVLSTALLFYSLLLYNGEHAFWTAEDFCRCETVSGNWGNLAVRLSVGRISISLNTSMMLAHCHFNTLEWSLCLWFW